MWSLEGFTATFFFSSDLSLNVMQLPQTIAPSTIWQFKMITNGHSAMASFDK